MLDDQIHFKKIFVTYRYELRLTGRTIQNFARKKTNIKSCLMSFTDTYGFINSRHSIVLIAWYFGTASECYSTALPKLNMRSSIFEQGLGLRLKFNSE